MSKAYHSEVFRYDDLFWSQREIDSVTEEARAFCKAHNGNLSVKEGHVSYSCGQPYYACPEDWPGYIVSWEE